MNAPTFPPSADPHPRATGPASGTAIPADATPAGHDVPDAEGRIRSSYTAGGPEGRVTHHPLPQTHPYAGGQRAHGWDRRDQRSYLTAALLSILVGAFGVDRFYLGKIGTGVLKLVTFGGFGVWWIIDAVLLLVNQTRDAEGRELHGYEENRTTVYIVAGIVGGLTLINGFWFPVFLI